MPTLTAPPAPVVTVAPPPAASVSPPFAAVMASLISMLRTAVSVSVFAADQPSASLTKISPLPSVAPSLLDRATLPPSRLVESVAPVMSPPEAAMVRSFGSMSQVPDAPPSASVVTRAVSAMESAAPEVSTKPPVPPSPPFASPPFASIVPEKVVLPVAISVTSPPSFPSAVADTSTLPDRVISLARTFTSPPEPSVLRASSVPSMETSPPAVSRMRPSFVSLPVARITPSVLPASA